MVQNKDGSAQTAGLSKRHRRELKKGSGISKAVSEARGYRTVTDKTELLKETYEGQQLRVPGLLVPIRDVAGSVRAVQYKADDPRTNADGDPVKYDNPKGSRLVLDVPVAAAADLHDPSVPLWVTEGAKKADAAVTAGLCCIGVLGVWGWKRDGEPLPDWDHIELQGREVFLAYDSDVMRKPEVQSALDGLTAFLRERGAAVRWVLLPEAGSLAGETVKVGLDDWLVANEMDPSGLTEFVREPEVNIRVTNVPPRTLVRQAAAALRVYNDPAVLFERDGFMVEAQPSGVRRVTDKRLMFLMTEAADWYSVSEKARRSVNPPKDVRDNLSVAPELWGFDTLDRIVTTPVFAKDGTLRTEPGYHQPSRSFYFPPKGLNVPAVSTSPSRKEVKKAKRLVADLFTDFAFVDDADRAHAWALLLQPFAREMIRGYTPLFSVQAPKQGTGKTLLVQSALAPAVGDVDSYADPHVDTEMEKRLTSLLRGEAAPVVFFDNIDPGRLFHYPSLASALTKPTWMSRVLGVSENVTLTIHSTFVITANNPRFSDDMSRRVVPIRLDTSLHDPAKRSAFTHSLPAWAHEHRGDLVWAACTLIASWVAAGRPRPGDDTSALASYGPWRRVIGGVLEHIGLSGFLDNLHTRDETKAPDVVTLERLCQKALDVWGDGTWTAREIAAEIMSDTELELDFGRDFHEVGPLTRYLGRWLSARKEQVTLDHRLIVASRGGTGTLWRFERVGADR